MAIRNENRQRLLFEGLPLEVKTSFANTLHDFAERLPPGQFKTDYQVALKNLSLHRSENNSSTPMPNLLVSEYPLAVLLQAPTEDWPESLLRLRDLVSASVIILIGLRYKKYASPVQTSTNAVRQIAQQYPERIAALFKDVISPNDWLKALNKELSDELTWSQQQLGHLTAIKNILFKAINKKDEIRRYREGLSNLRPIRTQPIETEDTDVIVNLVLRDNDSRQNNTGINNQEWAADQEYSSFLLEIENNGLPADFSRIHALQSRRNRAVADSIIQQQDVPPCSSSVINEYEAKILCSTLLDELSGFVNIKQQDSLVKTAQSLFLLLALILGRDPKQLLSLSIKRRTVYSISEYWVIRDGRIFLNFGPQIPMRDIRKNVPEIAHPLFNSVKTSVLSLPIPQRFTPLLLKIFNNPAVMSELKATPVKIPPNIKKKLGRKITVKSITKYAKFQFQRQGLDDVVVAWLTGTNENFVTAVYYTQLKSKGLVDIFCAYVRHMGIPMADKSPDLHLGTALVPSDQTVTKIFGGLSQYLETLEQTKVDTFIAFHNAFTLYVYLILTLATGHRPVGINYKWIRARRNPKYLFIRDKRTSSNKTGRPVPLSKTASEQLVEYCNYLDWLNRSNIHMTLDPGNQELGHLLSEEFAEGGFFVFDERRQTLDLTPLSNSWLKYEFKTLLPIQQNWPRHFLRTHLTGVVSSEILNKVMGHGQMGQGADAQFSGMAVLDFGNYTEEIDKLFKHLGVAPFRFKLSGTDEN